MLKHKNYNEFYTYFQQELSVIQSAKEPLGRIIKLEAEVTEQSLPSYDKEKYLNQIQELKLKYQTKRSKFSFKDRTQKKQETQRMQETMPVAAEPDGKNEVNYREGEIIHIPLDSINVELENLKCCVIVISHSIASLTLTNCKGIILPSADTETSVMLTNCHHSILKFRCRQTRIHDSSKCQVQIDSVNACIIEGCKDMTFYPYPESQLQVNDFNWLKKTPSPNFVLKSFEDILTSHDTNNLLEKAKSLI